MPFTAARRTPRTYLIEVVAVRDAELMQTARVRSCRTIGGRAMVESQCDADFVFMGAPPRLA